MTTHAGSVSWRCAPVALLVLVAGCGADPVPIDSGQDDVDAGVPVDAGRAVDAAEPPESDASTAGVLISAATGGTVLSADGLFELIVLPGALAADTTISVSRVASADVPSELEAAGPVAGVYALEPDGLTFGGDGAWAHWTLDAIPPALVTAGSPSAFRSAAAVSVPAAGGAIEHDAATYTLVDPVAGRLDIVSRLTHLSYHTATEGPITLSAELGASTHTVWTPWSASRVTIESPETFDGLTRGTTVLQVTDLGSVRGTLPDAVVEAPTDLPTAISDRFRGLEHRELLRLDATTPTMGGRYAPSPPTYVCRDSGGGAAWLSAAWINTGSVAFSVAVSQPVTCQSRGAVEASVEQTSSCRREGDVIDCAWAPPATSGHAESASAARTFNLARGGGYVLLTPPAAPPGPRGPDEIAVASGGSGVHYTYDELTDAYIVTFDPAPFTIDDPLTWSLIGEDPVVTDLDEGVAFHFGPATGADTDVIVTGAPAEDGPILVELTGMGDAPFVCAGVTYEADGITLVGRMFVEDLGDGTRGLDAPIRVVFDDAAAFCEIPVATFEATPFHIDIGLAEHASLESPAGNVEVSAQRTISIASPALLAACPAGRTYCTDRCVDTARDPMNCGGCGLAPLEVCDGVDSNCNGSVDEGCPRTNTWGATSPHMGSWWGDSTMGSSAGPGCPYPGVTTGLCVYRDPATGDISALGGRCGSTDPTLMREPGVTPYVYHVVIRAPTPPCSSSSVYGSTIGRILDQIDCGPNMVVDGMRVTAGASSIGQIEVRCAAWDVRQGGDGTWRITRVRDEMMRPLGMGSGTPTSYFVPDDPVGNAGAVREMFIRYTLGGNLRGLQLWGASPRAM